jgi:hypothetical protein
VLHSAYLWLDARDYSGSGNWLDKSGNALNAVNTGATFLRYAGQKHAYLPGIAANYISTPDDNSLDLTTELDIRVRVALADYTPPTVQTFLSKDSAANKSYAITMGGAGLITLNMSVLGVAFTSTASSSAATGFTDGSTNWIRVTWRSSDGRVQFFTANGALTAPAGGDWVQLGTNQTAGAAISLFNGVAPVELGSSVGGTTSPTTGSFYQAEIRSTIDGTVVAQFNANDAIEPYATVTDSTGKVWTFNRAASGKKLSVVDRSLWLLGTDDNFAITDSPFLDAGITDSFTVACVSRLYGVPAAISSVCTKRVNSGTAAGSVGWSLATPASANFRFILDDGTLINNSGNVAVTAGTKAVFIGQRIVPRLKNFVYRDGLASNDGNDNTTATLVNAEEFRVGKSSGAGASFYDGEIMAVAFWRRPLTISEMIELTRVM